MAHASDLASKRSAAVEQFDALYSRYARTLYDYFVGRTSDVELARDLVQETCVRLWRSLVEVNQLPEARQRAWLFTVARNLVIDAYRARASSTARHDAVAALRLPAESTAPPADADLGADENLRELDGAIARLADPLREVLVLHVLGDRNSTEIGEILGRPPGTVRYQLAQARRLLARELSLVDAGASA